MLVQLRNVKAGPEETEQLFYVQPGAMEVKKREDYQEYIPREGFQVYRDKLKKEGRITHDREFVDNNPNPDLDHMFTYVIDNDILYLRFSNFSIIAQLGNHNKSGEEVAPRSIANTPTNSCSTRTSRESSLTFAATGEVICGTCSPYWDRC